MATRNVSDDDKPTEHPVQPQATPSPRPRGQPRSPTSNSPFGMPTLFPFNSDGGSQPFVSPMQPPTAFEPGMSVDVWRRTMESYMATIPPHQRTACLWNHLSPRANEVLAAKGCDITSEESKMWRTLAAAFPEKVGPTEATILFWDRRQRVGEDPDDFANDLSVLAHKAFPSMTFPQRQALVLGCFTRGVTDPHTRASYIQSPPTTLEDAIATARRFAAAQHLLSAEEETLCRRFTQATPSNSFPNTRPSPVNSCFYCNRFGTAARRCGHNPIRFGRQPASASHQRDQQPSCNSVWRKETNEEQQTLTKNAEYEPRKREKDNDLDVLDR